MDVSTIIDNAVVPSLNGSAVATLDFWTAADLYKYADETIQALARAGCFLESDASITVSGGASGYSLPSDSIQVLYAFAGDKELYNADITELEALSPTWPTDEDNFLSRFAEYPWPDGILFYPLLYTGKSIGIILLHAFTPTEVTVASPTVSAPAAIAPLIALSVIAGARMQESEGRMPEVAETAQGLVDMLQAAMVELWGTA